MKCVFLYISLFFLSFVIESNERFFTIVVPSFNNIDWVQKNLDSLFSQDYQNFNVIYIDDNSNDGTGDYVEKYIQRHGLHDKCTLIRNIRNYGALYNIYRATHSCPNDRVIVTVDGDDWLAHDGVLKYLNQVYSDENVWISYGQYETSKGGRSCCIPYESEVVEKHIYRESMWRASHLRTFYAGLFKQINIQDFWYNGSFLKVSWDLSFMYPMLEMASGRYRCVQDILYTYNVENPISDHRIDLSKQLYLHFTIANRERYQPLKKKDSFLAYPNAEFSYVLFIEDDNDVKKYAGFINRIGQLDLCKEIIVFSTVGFPQEELRALVTEKCTVVNGAYFSNDLFNSANHAFYNQYKEKIKTIETPYVIFSRNRLDLIFEMDFKQLATDLARTSALAVFFSELKMKQNIQLSSPNVATYQALYELYPLNKTDLVEECNLLKGPIGAIVQVDDFKKSSAFARIVAGCNSIVASLKGDNNDVCLWYQKG